MSKGKQVCVTGAGGYIASHLVKLLLSKDYIVHGTVRSDPGNAKYAHLMKLEKAEEKLKLFKADILDYDSVHAAISGCDGVFHVANPVIFCVDNPEVELMEPAVKGTLNVLKACSDKNVKRTIYASSVGAVCMNPNWPKGKVRDESCWSDSEYCKRLSANSSTSALECTQNWYFASKTAAEMQAFEYARINGLDLVSVCPSTVFGPLLQPTVNTTSRVLISLLKDGLESVENKYRRMVDVRDVAEALILVYEKPDAKGRYICTSYFLKDAELLEKLKNIYPNFNYPKSFTEVEDQGNESSEKLQRLGWSFRPLEETLIDSVESYREAGIL